MPLRQAGRTLHCLDHTRPVLWHHDRRGLLLLWPIELQAAERAANKSPFRSSFV